MHTHTLTCTPHDEHQPNSNTDSTKAFPLTGSMEWAAGTPTMGKDVLTLTTEAQDTLPMTDWLLMTSRAQKVCGEPSLFACLSVSA